MPANWMYLGDPSSGAQGLAAYGAGGFQSGARDAIDAKRMAVGQIPEAQYPDGYLGTIQSRREDRLLDSLKDRGNQRSYQRGVHKGERIDPSDYFWPRDLDPQRGLKLEAKGLKTAPTYDTIGIPPDRLVENGRGLPLPRGAGSLLDLTPQAIDPKRRAQLAYLMPTYR